MNVSLTSKRSLADVDSLIHEVSDDLVVQLVATAFARTPLEIDELREVRLVAFLLDISGRVGNKQLIARDLEGPRIVVADDRLKSLAGLSAQRIQRSISRLVEARVLEQIADDPPGWFRLAPKAMQPGGLSHYVSWSAVIAKIAGRVPAILLLRAVLDLIVVPWDWTRLTYDQLAARASYSLGMAQRGVMQLVESAVLERASHSGRGHEYRLSSWALGRGSIPVSAQTFPDDIRETISGERIQAGNSLQQSVVANDNLTSMMAVEIGGLILRVPVGTEIRMTLGADSMLHYEVGSELKISRRG